MINIGDTIQFHKENCVCTLYGVEVKPVVLQMHLHIPVLSMARELDPFG